MEYNFVQSLSKNISKLVNLQLLNLNFNEITSVPLEITKLTKLREFLITQNSENLTTFPNEIQNWIEKNNIKVENSFQKPDMIVKGKLIIYQLTSHRCLSWKCSISIK